MSRAKTGGRTATISAEDVIEAGIRIGLAKLTVQRVATELGVTPAALYRFVRDRRDLEYQVGEEITARFQPEYPSATTTGALLRQLAEHLRDHALAHPGVARYMRHLFPRSEVGIRLVERHVAALAAFGYHPATALAIGSAVVDTALALVVADEQDPMGAEEQDTAASRQLLHDSALLSGAAEEVGAGGAIGAAEAVGAGLGMEPDRATIHRATISFLIEGLISAVPPDAHLPPEEAQRRLLGAMLDAAHQHGAP